jgi:hypothetical protein
MRYDLNYIVEGEDYRCGLQIIVDGVVVATHWDQGEPEDNSFFRDWSWVFEALLQAYKLGYAYGAEDMEKVHTTSSGT